MLQKINKLLMMKLQLHTLYQVSRIKAELDDLEQHGRSNNLRINGIPQAESENMTEQVNTLANNKFGFTLDDRDLDCNHGSRNLEHVHNLYQLSLSSQTTHCIYDPTSIEIHQCIQVRSNINLFSQQQETTTHKVILMYYSFQGR